MAETRKETECKFCHAKTWYDLTDGRVYENKTGGEFHVTRCPRRANFYHKRAMDAGDKSAARAREAN